jgi:hypothetical protein
LSDLINKYLQPLDTLFAIGVGVVAGASWIAVRVLGLVRGRPERRYTEWFLDHHGKYWNPYLDRAERLDVERTHVPLSFVEGHADGGAARLATAVMADRAAGNVIVLGDAGSGKTTTLKAYGVLALRTTRDARRARRRLEVPFFVPIRVLATVLNRGGLLEYIRSEILQAGARMTAEEAQRFLAQVLKQDRCVVLLDGLDEVGNDDYREVRDEIHRFASDLRPDLPTGRARLVATCRRYNFLRMEQDWVGPHRLFGEHAFEIAPLRDVEIIQYLQKFRDRFKHPGGAEHFLTAIRDSNTLHLHRTPMVLAMSVGLYAEREFFEVPHSIAELYDTMIKEMLDRRLFQDAVVGRGGTLRFLKDDKLRLLREFALQAAQEPTGFGPFDRRVLVVFARQLRPALQRVPEGAADALVDEIVDSSGLLVPVSDQTYEFAHRSIQEHLVVTELIRAGEQGTRRLMNWALNRDWRQVVLFFTAATDQRVVSPFLVELAGRDLILAGGCLAGADCQDEVAIPILARLAEELRAPDRRTVLLALGALIGATASLRREVHDAAKGLIYDALSGIMQDSDAVSVFGGDVDGVVDVLNLLIDRMGQAELSGALVTRLTDLVPDDPRLVEPLWQYLSSASTQRLVAAGQPEQHVALLIERLLTLATDAVCFEELERQPAPEDLVATAYLLRQAYPFSKALDPNHNLVTALCWAERIGLAAPNVNRFLEAKANHPQAWARIEADRHRTGLVVQIPPRPRLYRKGRRPLAEITGTALALLSFVVLVAVLVDLGRVDPALDSRLRIVVLLLAAVELGLAITLFGVGVRMRPARRVSIWRANPCIDVYDDPRSRHWMVRSEKRPALSS